VPAKPSCNRRWSSKRTFIDIGGALTTLLQRPIVQSEAEQDRVAFLRPRMADLPLALHPRELLTPWVSFTRAHRVLKDCLEHLASFEGSRTAFVCEMMPHATAGAKLRDRGKRMIKIGDQIAGILNSNRGGGSNRALCPSDLLIGGIIRMAYPLGSGIHHI